MHRPKLFDVKLFRKCQLPLVYKMLLNKRFKARPFFSEVRRHWWPLSGYFLCVLLDPV
jgi:hypothetical protein